MIGSRDAYVAYVAFIQHLIFQDSRASFIFLAEEKERSFGE